VNRVAMLAALAAGVAACADDLPAPGERDQAIIGGTTAPFDEAVVMYATSAGSCTGTLIRPNVVLTAAHCLGGSLGRVSFGPDLSSFYETVSVIDTFKSRRYSAGIFDGGDAALLRLQRDVTDVEPVPFNTEPLTQADVGAEIRTVGFGNTDGVMGTGFGTRRQVTHYILGVDDQFITFGTPTANTCQGDSGGPTFMAYDGVERVIAVTSFGDAGCMGQSRVDRVDVFVDEFITEVLEAWSGPCAYDGNCVTSCTGFPDPDCDPCGLDGFCASGCTKKDLDCPMSGGPGDLCNDREGCESLLCVPGLDDPRVHYCSEPCDPASPSCPAPLSLCQASGSDGDACFIDGISPSAQGAPCAAGGDCRSGICDPDDQICIELCGDGIGTCGDGYDCDDIGSGMSACRLHHGGCQVGGGSRAPWLGGLLVALAAILVARRLPKRRRS